jgi:putative membrane protein
MSKDNKNAQGFSLRRSFFIYIRGFAMGIADIIPGVSGGTIAFITGIYDDLLKSVSAIDHHLVLKILKLKFKDAYHQVNGNFIAPLFVGILTAIISTSKLVHYLLHSHPEKTWSLFFGLIAASIFIIAKQVEAKLYWKNLVGFSLGIMFGFSLVSLIPVVTPDSYFFLLICGMIAITAMILPGISGSFFLVILGKYATVTGALKDLLNLENFKIVLVFSIGALIGLVSFSKFLKWLLTEHRAITLSALTGIMLGAMKKIWPWRNILATKTVGTKLVVTSERFVFPSELSSHVMLCIILMFVGAALVLLLEKISNSSK